MKDDRIEEINKCLLDICPQAVSNLRDLITNPNTPVTCKAQLIGMVLDRVLGKAETPVKVTTSQKNMDNAETRLMAIIQGIQEEETKELN